jgi:hypothetical protein
VQIGRYVFHRVYPLRPSRSPTEMECEAAPLTLRSHLPGFVPLLIFVLVMGESVITLNEIPVHGKGCVADNEKGKNSSMASRIACSLARDQESASRN